MIYIYLLFIRLFGEYLDISAKSTDSFLMYFKSIESMMNYMHDIN